MGRTSDARQKLIESAIELIHSRSYADVGVNELCQHAGVKKGSFYHFFPSKQDLTLEALDVMADYYQRYLAGPALSQDLPFVEKVRGLLELSYQYHQEVTDTTGHMRGCPFGNLAVELSTQDEPIRLKVQQIFGSILEWFEEALRSAVASGELPEETDIPVTARSVLAYLEGTLLLSKAWNDPQVIRQLARNVPLLIKAGAG